MAAPFRIMNPFLTILAAALLMTCSTPFLVAQDEDAQDETKEKKSKPGKENYRTFTAKNGKSLEARVVSRIDDERYTIETPEGKSFTINIKSLIRSDQTYLELWEPDAILDLATADLAEVLEKMNYRSVELVSTGSKYLLTAEGEGEELKLLIEPGRPFSILSPESATDLGLELSPGSLTFTLAGGKQERSQQATIPKLTVGELEVESVTFIVCDLKRLIANVPGSADGALGQDLLEKLNALVDHGGKRLFVREDQPE